MTYGSSAGGRSLATRSTSGIITLSSGQTESTYLSSRRGGCAASALSGARGSGGHRRCLASAALARERDVVRIDVNGKVLQAVGVAHSLCGVRLGQRQTVIVRVGEVVNDTMADALEMEDAVDKVGCPVLVERAVRDGVTQTAKSVEGVASGVGQGADDRLIGGVGPTPVTSPG